METTTGTSWVVQSVNKEKNKTYFQCNRSGRLDIKHEQRKRNFKGLVTNKTNTECASHLVLTVRDGKWLVKFCVQHTSHAVEKKFLRLLDATKVEIGEKLREGHSTKDILDTIRKESENGFNASTYCSKKTIENIISKLQIGKEYMFNKSDAHSVDALVKNYDGKSFFIYKPMGIRNVDYPKANDEDFMLAYMCEKQRTILLDCMQGPIATLCIDSTHGTNAYHIKLTTLLTINSLGSGVPVAFFFSTKEDEHFIGYFLSAIKKLVGELKPKVN